VQPVRDLQMFNAVLGEKSLPTPVLTCHFMARTSCLNQDVPMVFTEHVIWNSVPLPVTFRHSWHSNVQYLMSISLHLVAVASFMFWFY